MFKLSIFDKFRNPKFEDDDDVKLAWYTYIVDFMKCVSSKWKKIISEKYMGNRVKIDSYITISDEAFVRWLLWLKLDHYLELNKKGELQLETKIKKTRLGPHDSKHHIDYYSKLYKDVKESRKDGTIMKKWNDIFWEQAEIYCPGKARKKRYGNNYNTNNIGDGENNALPSRDEIEEELY